MIIIAVLIEYTEVWCRDPRVCLQSHQLRIKAATQWTKLHFMVAYKEAIILVHRDISSKNVKAVRNGAHSLCTHNLEQGLAPFPAVNLQFSENLTNKTINFDYNKKIYLTSLCNVLWPLPLPHQLQSHPGYLRKHPTNSFTEKEKRGEGPVGTFWMM